MNQPSNQTKTIFYKNFPDFYANPLIQYLAQIPRWSVSTKDKCPINFQDLMKFGKIHGAYLPIEKATVSLPVLLNFLPNAANHAFFLSAVADGVICLDVEPDCPEQVKQRLLQLPYQYGEYSLSGKGYHLWFPLPANFADFPEAAKKVVLKEQHRWYEIHLEHWVTFTRNILPPSSGTASLEAFYASIASVNNEKKPEIQAVNVSLQDVSDLDRYMIQLLLTKGKPYAKSPADFHNDMSSFEFSVMCYLSNKINWLCTWNEFKNIHLDKAHKANLMYLAAQQMLPHRPKHDELRQSLPWLLFTAKRCLERGN